MQCFEVIWSSIDLRFVIATDTATFLFVCTCIGPIWGTEVLANYINLFFVSTYSRVNANCNWPCIFCGWNIFNVFHNVKTKFVSLIADFSVKKPAKNLIFWKKNATQISVLIVVDMTEFACWKNSVGGFKCLVSLTFDSFFNIFWPAIPKY